MRKLRVARALLPGGWAADVVIALEDGVIASVEIGGDADGAERWVGIAVPGLPNLHSHTFQRGMAGLSEARGPTEDSFWTWREVMYRFLDQLSPDDVEAMATLAFVEMLETGFTAVAEFHYLHHAPDGRPYANPAAMAERIAAAAAATGIGLTLLPVLYRWGGFDRTPPTPGQRRFLSGDDEAFARLVEASGRAIAGAPDARLGIAPHSLRAVGPVELRFAAALAPCGPVHIHAAEQEREVADCIAWSGSRPVEWLLAEMDLDERWCLVHATHMTPREARDLAASGAVAGLCPVTEANLGDGIMPATAYLEAGGRFGVGTDSNILIGAADELRGLEYAQRLRDRRRSRLARSGHSVGRTLFDAAAEGGARACDRRVGALAPGRQADILLLDGDHPSLAGRDGDALLDGFVFAAGRCAIRDVIVGGRHVVQDGRHVLREQARKAFTAALTRILA